MGTNVGEKYENTEIILLGDWEMLVAVTRLSVEVRDDLSVLDLE